MIRIAILVLMIAAAVGIVTIYGLRQGGAVLMAVACLMAFTAAMVLLRYWVTRGCRDHLARSDSSAVQFPPLTPGWRISSDVPPDAEMVACPR